MCGILGLVNFDGRPVDPADVEKMSATLSHRGPDGHRIWVDGMVGLGHRRLAIRDLSEAGAQPMVDHKTGITVTYNGEIYNDADVRRMLEATAPVEFTTSCDTEVIAPSYRAWGSEAFLRFEGMYALALWDSRSETLVLARDPIGIKPLYYSWVGKSLRFASEIKALLSLDDQPRKLSAEGLHRYFAQGYAGPERTTLEGIVPLPPGSVLIANRDGFRVEQFWQPTRTPKYTRLEDALDAFEAIWPTVVKDQLISDVPVGLLLSGGIDSALVATALKDRNDVPAYTAVFGDAAFDESSLAAMAARHAGLSHQLVSIDTEHDIEARFLDVVAKLDGQLADSSSLAFYSLCREARKHVPVLLTGDGADEFFAGYETYRATRFASAVGPLVPQRFARSVSGRLFNAPANGERIGRAEKLARFFSGLANGGGRPHPQWRRYLYPEQSDELYDRGMGSVDRSVDALEEYADAFGTEGAVMDRSLLADQRYYLPGDMLVKSDAMSMAHGVEVRVPFLDRRIMEFANSLAPSLVSPLQGPDKRILRAALKRAGLPEQLTRAGKRGFNVPVTGYLRRGLKAIGDRLLDRDADVLAPFLRPDAVRKLWRGFLDGQNRDGYTNWTLLTLASWRAAASV